MDKSNNIPVYTQDLIHNNLVNIVHDPDIEEHRHCFWEINLIVPHSDKITKINGEYINTENGLLCLLRPYKDRHFVQSTSETLYNHYDMYVFPDRMKNVCELLDASLYDTLLNAEKTPMLMGEQIGNNVLETRNSYNAETIINEIKVIKEFQKTNQFAASTHCSSLLAYILGSFTSFLYEKDPTPTWIKDLIEKIESMNDFSSFSLSDLISSLHYTHGHICREFKKHTNSTLIGYINNVKLDKSINLLAQNLKIIDIANTLGYCSQSAFENAFKKRYNISPGTWRKQFRHS